MLSVSILILNSAVAVGFPEHWDPDFGAYLDNLYHGGYPRALDINNGDPIGIGVVQSSVSDRSRVTASTAFLTARPPDLTIMTGRVVEKVMLDGKRASGVVLSDGTSMTTSYRNFQI